MKSWTTGSRATPGRDLALRTSSPSCCIAWAISSRKRAGCCLGRFAHSTSRAIVVPSRSRVRRRCNSSIGALTISGCARGSSRSTRRNSSPTANRTLAFFCARGALNIDPQTCLVFEDSAAGVLAAKAGRMSVVAVPTTEDLHQPAFALADLVLDSLVELTPQWLDERFA